jgi:hypothetical protein
MKKENGKRTDTQVTETTLLCRRADSPTPLESWKDIAAYFQRSVRTVQRWEVFENMPVHRHRHASGGSAFAYAHELDAWRDGRSQRRRAVSKATLVHTETIADLPLDRQAALRALLKEIVRQLGETPVQPSATPTHHAALIQNTSNERTGGFENRLGNYG